MIWFDLLYPSEEKWEQGKEGGRVSPWLAHDLQLERLVEAHVLNKTEFGALCQELDYLPVDKEVILHRQEVLQDLIQKPHFLDKYENFCQKLKNNVPIKRNIWDKTQPVYKNLEENIGVLEANYQAICTANLGAETEFRSDALVGLVRFLGNHEYKKGLGEIIGHLKELLENGAIRYRPEYTYGQVLDSVTIQGLYRGNYYITKEKGLLKKTVVDKDYLIPADNIILSSNMDEIYSKTTLKLCDFASRLNSAIVNAFRRIQREIPYYRAGIRLYEICQQQGIGMCLPRVREGCGAFMEFRSLYPIYLLAEKAAGGIQSNSYSNEEGRIAIVTGHNSGGKTTFLQAVGLSQIMMQLGFYVPADFFEASAAGFIGSLFSCNEDAHTIYGKLEQELVAMKSVARMLKKGSLLLMNEILATTSEREGADIAAEAIHAFSETHSHLIFVTHLKCLADMAQEKKLALAEGEYAINYVTEQWKETDGRVKKTHRIVKGSPETGILERELLEKYFGSKE